MQKNTLKILKRQRDQVWFQLCKKAQTNFEWHHFFIGLANIGGNKQPKAIKQTNKQNVEMILPQILNTIKVNNR